MPKDEATIDEVARPTVISTAPTAMKEKTLKTRSVSLRCNRRNRPHERRVLSPEGKLDVVDLPTEQVVVRCRCPTCDSRQVRSWSPPEPAIHDRQTSRSAGRKPSAGLLGIVALLRMRWSSGPVDRIIRLGRGRHLYFLV